MAEPRICCPYPRSILLTAGQADTAANQAETHQRFATVYLSLSNHKSWKPARTPVSVVNARE
jgi:hypothetical protein